jgi:hypothetical protein
MDVADTLLGRTMRNAVQELGGRITGWSQGVDRAGKPFIQAVIAY